MPGGPQRDGHDPVGYPTNVQATFGHTGADCSAAGQNATAGTIDVSSIDGGNVAGSFNLTFPGGALTGSFRTAGMIIAGLAIIAFVIDLIGGKQIRTLGWSHAVGYPIAVVLSLMNAFVHSRDGYTAVVPTGLTLSALVVVILLFTAWVDRALVSRRRFGAGT